MDFLFFLAFVAIVFYMTKIHPQLKQKLAELEQNTHVATPPLASPFPSKTTRVQTKNRTRANSKNLAPRSRIPTLLGIEITAIQQRRLGRNDPSVIAFKQNKAKVNRHLEQQKNVWTTLIQETEQMLKQGSNAKLQTKAPTASNSDVLTRFFNDLFTPKK